MINRASPFRRPPHQVRGAARAEIWRLPTIGKIRRNGMRALVALALMYAMTLLAATGATEYQIKAVFLFKFIKFVDWPGSVFSETNSPLVVGIIGDDPFGSILDKVFRDETVGRRPIVVRRLGPREELKACHVLFISHSERDHLSAILNELAAAPVLTVGDTPHFAERGAVANLVLVDETVKLEVNLSAARQASLQVSSKLLNLDRVVKVKPERPVPSP